MGLDSFTSWNGDGGIVSIPDILRGNEAGGPQYAFESCNVATIDSA